MFSHFLTSLKTNGSLTTDLIVLGIILLIFFFYGIYFGKNRLISLIVSFYPAMFLYGIFPFATKLMILHGGNLILLNKILIFLIFLIPLDIIIARFVSVDSGYGGAEHYLRIGVSALILVALTLIFTYSVISFDSLYNFSSHIDALFTSTRIFWWYIAPFAILFFL
ncbi:MAG: hypothetical protein V4473_00380 [Patescibacteria group bacterium]